eukprot:363192-Chlamydomonas_euryale.AAC.13
MGDQLLHRHQRWLRPHLTQRTPLQCPNELAPRSPTHALTESLQTWSVADVRDEWRNARACVTEGPAKSSGQRGLAWRTSPPPSLKCHQSQQAGGRPPQPINPQLLSPRPSVCVSAP